MRELSGWGGVPVVTARDLRSEDLEAACREAVLSRGLGRSYGDASLPPAGQLVSDTRLADRLLAFDPESGRLRAEAGLSLAKLHALFLPRGWSAPVVPGTQYVTLGGLVASDVHGKNHHVAGTFGEHVHALRMRVADGRVLEVSSTSEPELFRATLGGMGLMGHILEVDFQLERIPSPWILAESERFEDLDALLGGLAEASRHWTHSVAWLDTLSASGRGVLMRGRWAEPHEPPSPAPTPPRRISLPFRAPGFTLSTPGIRAVNALFFHRHRPHPRRRLCSPQAFFHPLDAIGHWNRLYGRSGFVQHQCVIPRAAGAQPLRRLLSILRERRAASFLSVLKDCGDEGRGLLSFPRRGLSLALDLPMRGEPTQALMDALNEVVMEAGGRIYLAKDALTRPEDLRAMEGPRLDAWQVLRGKWDPQRRLRSALSLRLLGDHP